MRILMTAALGAVLAAQAPSRLPVQVRLTHVAQDRWRVDYRFAEPVAGLELRKAGAYRSSAWKVLTPGIRREEDGPRERYLAEGGPFSALSIEISAYEAFAQGGYVPIARATDGGAAFYLGFLLGAVRQGGRTRAMGPTLDLVALEGETMIAPPPHADPDRHGRAYAYFGPAKPVASGGARLILDPATPAWVSEVFRRTSGSLSDYYAKAYERPLRQHLYILLAITGFEAPGLSLKGGAVNGQIVFSLGGARLKEDTPANRTLFTQLVAHELAHVWQTNVARGGFGATDTWVYEGGAEAMALDALVATGLWGPVEAEAFRKNTLAECEALKGATASYRGGYACGFQRFHESGAAVVPLWRALMEATETTGEPYSVPMLERALKARPMKPGRPE